MSKFSPSLRRALLLLALPFAAQAQQNVGIGTTAPDASAALDIVSTSKGALLPRVASAAAIASPATGLIVFQTGGTPGFYYNAGTPAAPGWQQLATAAGAAITASNGLTKTGQDIALGGTLSGATTITQGGFSLGFTGGNVGIGTGSAATRLSVKGAGLGFPATSGNAQSAGHYARFSDASALVLDIGGNGGSGSWLQSTNAGNLGTHYALLLNPNGGNVGVGTSNPVQKLDVAGAPATATINQQPLLRLTRPQTPGLKFANSAELSLGSYGTAVQSQSQLDFKLANGSTDNPDVTPLTLRGDGRVGIGVTSPTATFHVAGTGSTFRLEGLGGGSGVRLVQVDDLGNLSAQASIYPASAAPTPALASTTAGLNNPLVAVSGTLAVVLNRGAGSLSLYDLSNPGAPVLRGTYTGINTGVEVAISGNTAAVLCNVGSGYTEVYTLGAGAPVLAATLTPPAALSANGGGIAMVGTKLYAVYDRAASQGYFYVYDVSVPAAPVLQGTGNSGYFTPDAVAAAGSFAAVSNVYRSFNVINVSNPASPVVTGGGGPFAYHGAGTRLAMTTTAVSLLDLGNAQLLTYSLSAAGVPTLRNTFTTAASPVSVALNGNLAYVTCRGTNTLQIIDVSGGTAVLRSSTSLSASPNNVDLTSGLALVASGTPSNNLQVFSTSFSRTVTVEPDGSLSSVPSPSGATFIQNQTATTQSAGFNVSGNGYVGGTVGVGTTTPNSTLDVRGSEALAYATTGAATSFTLDNTHRTVRRFGTCATITLPAASTCPGRLYTVLNSNGQGAFTLNVTGGGSVYDDITDTTFSGTNAFPAATRLTVQSDGAGWIVVGR